MRILGIDLGSSSIKAVEMDSAFGRFDIHDHHEQPLGPDSDPKEALAQLLTGLKKSPDRIIVSLPCGKSTFRILQLPTRDKKAIQAGVGFELEDELPFSADECIFDYSLVSQTKQSSSIYVAATLKRHLSSHLETWQAGKVDPDIITTEAWAYRILLNRVLSPTDREVPVLLIQMGRERTTLYLQSQDTPILIREIPWGGRDLTQAVAQKYSYPLDQAESAKLDHGILSSRSDLSQDQREFSACLEAPFQVLLDEIQQIGLICKTITRKNMGLVYTAGGTALLPGVGEWLEEKLTIPTKSLLSLSSATQSGVTYSEQTDARFVLAASLALCLVGADRTQCLSFRKREFSKTGKSRKLNFNVLRGPLIGLGIVTFCLFLSLIVQSSVYRSRLASTDTQLEKSVRSFFGQLSSSALRTYMTNTSTLRASITREINKQRELAKLYSPNTHSPLNFLNGISNAIPKDVVVDMTQFQAGAAPTDPYANMDQNLSASFTFLTSNPQIAEKLAAVINNKLRDVQRGKTEEVLASDEAGTKKWKLTFSGKPNEDTYVK